MFESYGSCNVVLREFLGADDFLGCCERVCWYEVDVFVVVVAVADDLFVLFLKVCGGECNVRIMENVDGWGVDVGWRRKRKKRRPRRVVGESSSSSSSLLFSMLLLFLRLDEDEWDVVDVR